LKHPLSRRGLWIVLGAAVILSIALPLAGVLAQAGGPVAGVQELCPQCPVSFRTPSILAPASTETAQTLGLFNFIMVIAAVIFVLVEGLLIFAILRYRNRRPEQALQIHGNTKLEIAWTAMPAIILAVLLGFTLRTMSEIKALPTGKVVNVTAIGHQWWWEFRYPDLQITTANEIVVPLGSAIEVSIESVDVEHGFWVPELFGKVDAVPGYVTRLKFTPTTPGTFGGQCTQFCGTQHAQMRFSVIVVTENEFQTWATNNQQPAAAASGDAAAGENYLLNDATAQCKACHTINGTAANIGVTGPNLTHLASRAFIAGGVLANTPENLKAWLRDSQAIKPGNKMVIAPLDEQTINDIVAYLLTLK
jgi:cytochrome c oxidase subunit 2